jgi:hypothetical protein
MIRPDYTDGKIRVEKKFGLGAFLTENEPLIDGGGVKNAKSGYNRFFFTFTHTEQQEASPEKIRKKSCLKKY